MNNLIPFDFKGSKIKVIQMEGEPWFVAKGVCDALGINNTSEAMKRLDEDEKSTLRISEGGPESNIVNESGLYSLILRSNKPAAKTFKKWITKTVLPSIRKNGGYIANQENLSPAEIVAKGLLAAQNIIEEKQATIEQQQADILEFKPKAEALHRLSIADGSLCITNAAKDLQIRPKDLFSFLSANKWIYKRTGNSSWSAYQDKIQKGLLEHKTTIVNRSDGSEKITEQVRVTPKGLAKLALMIDKHNAA